MDVSALRAWRAWPNQTDADGEMPVRQSFKFNPNHTRQEVLTAVVSLQAIRVAQEDLAGKRVCLAKVALNSLNSQSHGSRLGLFRIRDNVGFDT